MARYERIQFVDDVDDELIPDGEERRFSCSFGPHEAYELDVRPENHDAIRAALKPFLKDNEFTPTGKRIKRTHLQPKQRRSGKARPALVNGHSLTSDERAMIRSWAIERGLTTSIKGRLPKAVVDEYIASNA
jgi:hypothetical protein